MSQYGGYQEDYSQQQQQQEPHQGAAELPGQSHGHHKKRLYPQQQYDFSAAAAPSYPGAAPADPAFAAAPAYGGYPGAAAAAPAGPGAVFTPAAGIPNPAVNASPYPQQADPLAAQFGAMNIGGGAPAPSYGQAPAAARPPLNQLYNIDLLASLPPPISDLALPPPPIIVPSPEPLHQKPEANGDFEHIRSSLNVVPTSNSLLKKSKLPFSLVIRPYTSLQNATDPPKVTSDTIICRCRRCRSYINPFVTFNEQAHRWKCNFCGLNNDVPQQFDWDAARNMRADRYNRTEMNYGVVEFVAPPEYMVRAPQPPVYIFILDVSAHAVQNGLLATAARTILENLDRIPNKDDRAQVAFIAVDSSLHYFHIPDNASQAEPSLLVISDLDDPFLPLPSGLLVNLSGHRASIEKLLSGLSEMFASNVNSNNALCSALKAAQKMIGNLGGKIVCLTASLPNVGVSKLEMREDRKLLGTSKESTLLQTASSFFKSFAIECNRTQVSIDMFLFAHQYQDVASLSNLPRFTGGQTYFYPGWSAARAEDAIKFAHELGEHLSMEISLESVLRVRSSSELRINAFYGNFFNRSSDLCSFPSTPRDQSYVVEVAIDDTITKPSVCFQVAVLHTTSDGERRIRVINLVLPTSSVLQDIYASADQLSIMAYWTHKAIERALSHGLQDARDTIQAKLYDVLSTYKKDLMTTNVGGSAPLQFCANLRMLPLLVNALVKNVGFRKSVQIPTDMRSAALCLLGTLPVKYLIKYLHPDFFSLFDMPDEAGLPNEETGEIVLPPKINLSGERLVPHGLYLIDDGQTMFIWVGRDVVPQLCLDAFGVESIASVPSGKTELPETDSPLNERIRAIVGKLREKKDAVTWQSLFIIKEDGDPNLRLWATTFLIEDRAEDIPSYGQFLTSIRDKLRA